MSLKTRIIPILLFNDSGLVKGQQFDSWRRVGSVMQAVKVHEMREVDELIVLDISATPNNRGPRFEVVSALCENLFMPVTVGGGIRNVNDVKRLLANGADKVAIGTAAIEAPEIIDNFARKFGSQAVVVSIDVRGSAVYSNCGRVPQTIEASAWAREAEARGAGEILLTSIDRDGMMNGYDLDLIREVTSAVDIPVIACGGCGSYEHMEQAIKAGAHAVGVGAMFQFTDNTPRGASRHLNEHGIPAR